MSSLLEKLEDQIFDFDDGSDEFAKITTTLAKLRTALESNKVCQPDIGTIIRMNSEYNKVYRDTRNGGKAMRAAINEWIEAKAEGEA